MILSGAAWAAGGRSALAACSLLMPAVLIGPQVTPPPNRPPAVRLFCDPCRVAGGHSITLLADAQDPDGDPLTYHWTATAGTVGTTTARQTSWLAPEAAGPVVISLTVTDRRGATADAGVTIEVTRAAPPTYVFADILFAADSATIDANARRALEDIADVLEGNAAVHVDLTGLAEGEASGATLATRRATAVRDYLVGRGINTARLHLVTPARSAPAPKNPSRRVTIRLHQ